jgi:hypothetical protein
MIPRTCQILCSKCFFWSESLESVSFEVESPLKRIESEVFSNSPLQSIVIPRKTHVLDGSAFQNVKLSSISIESGNERFVIRDDFLIDIVDHKLIRNLSWSPSVIIPCDIEIVGSRCFSWCSSLKSLSFEVESRLRRIESQAFPRFAGSITIPSAVLFVAHDAIGNPSRLSLCDEDSCPEFGRWRLLRQSGTAVDFRRIVRGVARLPLDLTAFEEGKVIGKASRLYRRPKDGMEIVAKAFDVSEFEPGEVDLEIENLSNLRHPLMSQMIGFALSEGGRELTLGRMHAAGDSLAEVVFIKPGVVDTDGESGSRRRNCAGASVCARLRTAARQSEGGQCPLRR